MRTLALVGPRLGMFVGTCSPIYLIRSIHRKFATYKLETNLQGGAPVR